MPKIGLFSPKSGKWPFLAKKGSFCHFRDPVRGVFYINPSRRGPVTPNLGFSGQISGRALKGPFFRILGLFAQNGRFPGPEPRRGPSQPQPGQGPDARG